MPPRAVFRIDTETGELFIHGHPQHTGVLARGGASLTKLPQGEDPPADAVKKGEWSWAKNSPGCVYINHGGVWRKICF